MTTLSRKQAIALQLCEIFAGVIEDMPKNDLRNALNALIKEKVLSYREQEISDSDLNFLWGVILSGDDADRFVNVIFGCNPEITLSKFEGIYFSADNDVADVGRVWDRIKEAHSGKFLDTEVSEADTVLLAKKFKISEILEKFVFGGLGDKLDSHTEFFPSLTKETRSSLSDIGLSIGTLKEFGFLENGLTPGTFSLSLRNVFSNLPKRDRDTEIAV